MMQKRILATFIAAGLLLVGLTEPNLFAEEVQPQRYHQAINTIQKELKPGSLIFHRGKCLSVKIATQSPFTHVAIVMPEPNGTEWSVYDSARKHGVRKSELSEYLKESSPDLLSFLHPEKDLSSQQCEKLRNALDEQLGRPYSVTQHITGKRAKGIHCSEYVTDALIAVDLLRANKPPRVSPASLLKGIVQAKIYDPGVVLKVTLPACEDDQAPGWCRRIWEKTKTCVKRSCQKVKQLAFCSD